MTKNNYKEKIRKNQKKSHQANGEFFVFYINKKKTIRSY